jgi:hypothetical protein
MKPGNQRGVFAFCVVLVSVLLVSVSSVQAQTLPDVASPTQTSQAASPTETLSSSPTPPPAIKETDVSPEETLAPSPVEKEIDVPTTSIPSASPKSTWNFWQSTAGNWIMLAGALITVAITARVTWLVAKRSQKAQRELERDKPRLQHESQLELKAEEEAKREQTAEKHAIAYRQKLISGLCNLQIFKMSSPLNLEDVYVKLQVRQEEKLPHAKEEERVSLAVGEPTELLRLFQGHLAEQAATATSPEEALSRFKKITVLGEPGAGKTTILRHLAVKMANGALPNLPNLPVYVELRSFVESGMEDLLDFVVSNLAKPYNFPDRSYLEKKLNDGEAALLLDGLDEVLGCKSPEEAKKVNSRLAKIVTGLAIEFSNAPIAVTCRRAGWQGLQGFHTLGVLDFNESQIQEFVNNWFKSDPSKAQGLLQELEKNLRMKTLAGNPLILALMAIVYERELELPERRSELLQMLLDKTTASEKKPEIAEVLRGLKATSLVSDLLERLQDETIDWQIRWLLTESLEGLQESAIEPLREMLENPNINPCVRVGIAATLGTWRVRESISYLRKAIETQTVPQNLELSAGMLTAVYPGYVWGRIIRAFKSLSDDSIESLLVEIFQQYASPQDKSAWDKAGGIKATALEYNSEDMARQVLQMLRDKAWIECPNDLIRIFPLFTTKSLVPELLCLLEEEKIYTDLKWLWQEIVNAIGQVADDRETVISLGEMWSATSSINEEKRLLDAIYSAIYSASQRAKVRVNRDGQIE